MPSFYEQPLNIFFRPAFPAGGVDIHQLPTLMPPGVLPQQMPAPVQMQQPVLMVADGSGPGYPGHPDPHAYQAPAPYGQPPPQQPMYGNGIAPGPPAQLMPEQQQPVISAPVDPRRAARAQAQQAPVQQHQGPPGAPPASMAQDQQQALIAQVMQLTPAQVAALPEPQKAQVLALQAQLRGQGVQV